jgi:hypothetical protein
VYIRNAVKGGGGVGTLTSDAWDYNLPSWVPVVIDIIPAGGSTTISIILPVVSVKRGTIDKSTENKHDSN